ncbi:MAG: hypothetical protein MUP19_11300 [Candidatus Aminicenantes bacterium]|nr:hypothetical protein [Candidatus Aminicenantes bacterium]
MDKQKTHPTRSFKDVFFLIGGALILILLMLNIGPGVYKLFFWTVRISNLVVILCMAGLGFGLGYWAARRRQKKRAEKMVQPPAAPAPPQPPAGPSQPRA